MSEMPWVRFFPSDWLGGTRGMSAAETGIYITLIATMYERGEPVPEDHARLARLCGASNSAFKAALSTLVSEGKIQRVDGGLWNDRVGKESEFRSEKSEVGRQAAEARWSGKRNKNNGDDDADAMPSQSERNANQKPEARDRKKRSDDLANAQSSAGASVSKPPPIAEPVAQKKRGSGLGSAEDRFWDMAGPAGERGIARSAMGQLAKLLNGDFERGLGVLADAMAAKGPRPYLAKIIQNLKAEAAPSLLLMSSDAPQWASEARAQGYPVQREGRYWRMSGALYDDTGEQVGN